jgi:hypothetical protein
LALRHALPPRERGSFAVRQLYGIEEVVSRPDLGDRAIFLTLPPSSETKLWLQQRDLVGSAVENEKDILSGELSCPSITSWGQ